MTAKPKPRRTHQIVTNVAPVYHQKLSIDHPIAKLQDWVKGSSYGEMEIEQSESLAFIVVHVHPETRGAILRSLIQEMEHLGFIG